MRCLTAILIAGLLMPATALSKPAARPARIEVFEGAPVQVKIKAGHGVHISVPYDIRYVSIPPVEGNDFSASPKISRKYPYIATIIAKSIEAPVVATILTNADATYTVELIPADVPHTQMTIVDTEADAVAMRQSKPQAEPVTRKDASQVSTVSIPPHIAKQYQRQVATLSPLEKAIRALWYTQLTGKPGFGVSIAPRDQVTLLDATQEIRVVWAYQAPLGVYGFTQQVTNLSSQPLPLDVRNKIDAYANLRFISIQGYGVQALVEPGHSVMVHTTYLGGPQ